MPNPEREVLSAVEIASEPPTRRERRRVEIRTRILDAALHLFERQGYEATTVTQISKQADVAYGTFFNHFPTKLDLLRAISELSLHEMFQGIEEATKQAGSVTDRLVALFEHTADSAEEMGHRSRELLTAMTTLAFPETAATDDRRIRSAFRRFLDEGVAAGEIRDDVDLDTLTEVTVGTWYSLFGSWLRSEDFPLRSRASAASRFLASTMRAARED